MISNLTEMMLKCMHVFAFFCSPYRSGQKKLQYFGQIHLPLNWIFTKPRHISAMWPCP